MGNIAINVIKRDKSVEPFSLAKISNSCMRAGAKADVAKEIAELVSREAYQDIPTHELRKMVHKELAKRDPAAAEKYIKYRKK
ncbi:MAG: ATP cone domain-containing protein [Candidatus Aenigmatarchaeota archaeon]